MAKQIVTKKIFITKIDSFDIFFYNKKKVEKKLSEKKWRQIKLSLQHKICEKIKHKKNCFTKKKNTFFFTKKKIVNTIKGLQSQRLCINTDANHFFCLAYIFHFAA
jgi:hypothetical protein